jgi:protein-disulfide isomerase
MPRLKKDFIDTNKAKLVFKNKPYKEIHKTAFRKSEAAFCAFDQGGNSAFINYHDELFNRFSAPQEAELTTELTEIAGREDLDITKFQNCLDTGKFKSFIEKDIVESIAIDAAGTPVWLIGKTQNDKITDTLKIPGVHTYDVYKTIIEQLLSS